jgi:serine/threonine protein kinase
VKAKAPDPWRVKLSDFGISKHAADNLGTNSTVKGTLRYMAPELLGIFNSIGPPRTRDDSAADIWALGEITFQMLTKHATFKSDIAFLLAYVQFRESFPANTLRAQHVSKAGIDFVKSLMRPNPEDRLPAARALHHQWIKAQNVPVIEELLTDSTE